MTRSPRRRKLPAISALPTFWSPQSMTLRGATHSSGFAEALNQPTAVGATRFILICCFLLMMVTFTPPWRDEGLTGGAMDFVAMCKMAVRALVFFGMSYLIWRGSSSTGVKEILHFFLPWFAFASWAVLSTFWSPLKSVSFGQAASFSILILVALAVALTVGKAEFEQLIRGLVFALLGACLFMLVIYVALPDWGSLTRNRTGLLHATNASATASIGSVLLLASRLLYGWRWSRWLTVPGLLTFLAVLILAQSRTALAVTVVVCGGLCVVLAPPLWRALGMATCGISGVFYLALDLGINTTDAVLSELTTYLARGQTVKQITELSGREEMWTAMWDSFLQSPWIGHGYFVCSATGELYVWFYWGNWTAHNFWLQILVTTGIVGCGWMVLALAQYALRVLLAVRRGQCEWQFGVMVGAIMVWQAGWGVNNESFVGPVQPECVVYLALLGLTARRIMGNESDTSAVGLLGERDAAKALRPA